MGLIKSWLEERKKKDGFPITHVGNDDAGVEGLKIVNHHFPHGSFGKKHKKLPVKPDSVIPAQTGIQNNP